jgi:hypothetical protein
MYFNNTDKIVLVLQYDLYTDQYNKNQTGWLITLYKMGPGQVMLLYTSSLYFTLICFIEVQSKLYSYLSYAPHIGTILLEMISFSFPILTVCV